MNRQTATQTHQQKPTAITTAGRLLQRQCACGNHTMAGNECAECGKTKRFGLQTKLKINEPGDIYEREADRIADRVMAAPAHSSVSGAPPHIQRFTGQPTGQADTAPASVDRVLVSPGTPLDPALQADMSQRFGYDFSRVRVHSGAAAEQSARDVMAHAYTVGHDMVFGAGRFAPETHQGRRLLAHELTHVVQQSGSDAIRIDQSDEKRGLSPIPKSTGPRADAAARAVGANVFTAGSDIVFGAGHAPGMPQGGNSAGMRGPLALQRQPTASPAAPGRALYPTAGERGDIREILNPLAAKQDEPLPVTDPDGFKAAMQTRMKPYIDMVVAAARERESSSVSLSQGVIESLGDIAQPTVESFYGSYLRAAVHTPDETTRRAGFRLREHLHLVPNTPQPNTDAIARGWALSRMEQQGADLLSHFNVRAGEGARDQTLFAEVGDAIFEDRKDDIRTIVLFHPGFEIAGAASIQPKVAPLDAAEPVIETERRGRWDTLGTTIHEMLHAVTHERFEEVVNPLERSRIAVEGFTEYFTRPVYNRLAERAVNDDALRASIEGVAAPYKSSLIPPAEAGGYQQYVDAVHEIRRILGGSDEGLKLAYFQGLVEYIGLGGWNETEAARRRFPGNTLSFGALLTFGNSGLLRLDYGRVVMGRAGALQLRLGGQVNYLTQGERLGVAGTVSLRYQGTNAYVEGRLGIGGSAAVGGAPLSDTVRLDLIPGMEAGMRIGAFRVGGNAMLLVPITGGPVSDRVVRLGLGIGVGVDF